MIGGALYARVTLQGLARPCNSLTFHLATFCTFADARSVGYGDGNLVTLVNPFGEKIPLLWEGCFSQDVRLLSESVLIC
jgi:hypothetical protein